MTRARMKSVQFIKAGLKENKRPMAMKFQRLLCKDCGESRNIVEDYKAGYNVCGNCGCVVGNRIIDEGSEWRNFSDTNAPNQSRVGSANNPLLDVETYDTMISAEKSSLGMNLSKTQMRSSMRGPEQSLINGFNLISALCDRANMTRTICDRAKFNFKAVEEKKIAKSKSHKGTVAACIYIACRQEGCPRTFKEISVLTAVPRKDIGRAYKIIYPHLERFVAVSVKDIVSRFCSNLDLSHSAERLAVSIAQNVQRLDILTGKSTDSIAAAIVYLVTNIFPQHKGMQKFLQNTSNVTDVTIKNVYKELVLHKEEIVPPEAVSKYAIDLEKLA